MILLKQHGTCLYYTSEILQNLSGLTARNFMKNARPGKGKEYKEQENNAAGIYGIKKRDDAC
jgi:hypothetical protein